MATNRISNFLNAFHDLTSSAFQKAAPAVSALASKVADVVGKIPAALAGGASVVKAFAESNPNLGVIQISNNVLNAEEGASPESLIEDGKEVDVGEEGEEGELESKYVEVLAPSATIILSKPI